MQFKSVILLAAVVIGVASAGPILSNTIVEQLNLDASVQTLFPTVDDLNQKLEQVSQCYEPELDGKTFDIFNPETSIKSVVDQYYQVFSSKKITAESIRNLIVSINEIMDACFQSELDTVRYGLTELSDMSETELQSMTGAVGPEFTEPTIGNVGLKDGSDPECSKNDAPIPDSFDWREHGAVTPIRNQGSCGSCWAFAATGSIESALLVHKVSNDTNLALSVQQMVDCAKSNGCFGGNSVTAFDYVQQYGLTTEKADPYVGEDNGCDDTVYPRAATISDYCVRGKFRYNSNYQTESLSDRDMQESLVNNGPLYVLLNAGLWSKNYRGGVVTRDCLIKSTNHCVLLVGYTSNSWILKNSWGTRWGMDGYFEFQRGRNMCGINSEVAWPLL